MLNSLLRRLDLLYFHFNCWTLNLEKSEVDKFAKKTRSTHRLIWAPAEIQPSEALESTKALFFSVRNFGCGMGECGKGGEGMGES